MAASPFPHLKEECNLTDAEFMDILQQLGDYLKTDKTFITNPFREMEFRNAVQLAHDLFPEARIEIHDDPLQMGAMIFSIEDYALDVTETERFSEMVAKADNFEVYPTDKGNVHFAAVFQNVLVRI